jgi:rubredoxin
VRIVAKKISGSEVYLTAAYGTGGDDAVPGDIPDFEKIMVECICPKCGAKHAVNFPWTGRGVPRKYCPQCKKSL